MLVKKIFVLIALAAAFFIALPGPVNATEIDSCPYTISSGGYYELNTSLHYVGHDYCITIDADDVVFDCVTQYNITGNPAVEGTAILIADKNNVTVENCLITSFGANGIEATGLGGSSGCTFANNNVSYNGALGYDGFYVEDLHGSLFVNNTVNNNGYDGFYLDDWNSPPDNNDNNSFVNNTVNNNGNDGFYFSSAANNTLYNNTVTGNGGYGFEFDGFLFTSAYSTDNLVEDSRITGSATADIYSDDNNLGTNNFTNCVFDKSNALVDDGSINVFWYADIHTVNSTGDDLGSVTINESNVNGTSIYNGTTNSTGWLVRQTIQEYMQNSSGIYNYTPHWFNASKTGYAPNNTQTGISVSRFGSNAITRALTSSSPADYVTSIQYAPADEYNTAETAINFSVGCNATGIISHVRIWTNLTGAWAATYTNASYANGTAWNQTASGLAPNQYKWAVYCNDSAANASWSANRTFYISAVPAPTPTPLSGGGSTPTPTATPTMTLEPSVVPIAVASTPAGTPAPSLTASPTDRPTVSNTPSISSGVTASQAGTAVSTASALLSEAEDRGVDSSEARVLFDRAQKALSGGDYASAERYAQQAAVALRASLSNVGAKSSNAAGGFDWTLAGAAAAVLVLAVAGYWFYRKRG